MLYAIKDGLKVQATETGERALCPFTGVEMISKCGVQKINHWAYKAVPENLNYKAETEWHLNWKSLFNAEHCEVSHIDLYGNRHIADVDNGKTVYEFQHSPISALEVMQRELFYTTIGRNLVWVLDGATYLKHCYIEKVKTGNWELLIPYLTVEQRTKILDFNLKFGEWIDYVINGTTTVIKYSDLLGEEAGLVLKSSELLKDYQKAGMRWQNEVVEKLYINGSKQIFSVARGRIFIDVSEKYLYDMQNNAVIYKKDFIKLDLKLNVNKISLDTWLPLK